MYSPQLFPFLLKKLRNGIESVYKHERMMLRIGANKVDPPREGSRSMTCPLLTVRNDTGSTKMFVKPILTKLNPAKLLWNFKLSVNTDVDKSTVTYIHVHYTQ